VESPRRDLRSGLDEECPPGCQPSTLVNVTSPSPCHPNTARKRGTTLDQTDSLYIDLAERAGVDTCEVGDGIVIDLDANGHPVGIDIDQASKHLDLRTLDLRRIPFGAEKVAG
jgi:uncharacterized protein YuzE